ncbi:transmembrane protein 272-like [Oscarella lobularis]|uniref:transmembrane protein 272-like n=1 Tax=Oscarella lobularis TaxID=121494 RepID=UPI003313455A
MTDPPETSSYSPNKIASVNDAPPSYEDVAAPKRNASTSHSENGPPAYNSLFPTPNQLGRYIRRVSLGTISRMESESGDDERRGCAGRSRTARLVMTIAFVVFALAFIFGFPVAMIAIGAKNINECPIERFIPIFLIVMGVFHMIEFCGRVVYHTSSSVSVEEQSDEGSKDLVLLFLVAWFIAGNVWVLTKYSSYSPYKECNGTVTCPFTRPNPDYCKESLMNFSFWSLLTYYMILGLFLLLVFCVWIVKLGQRYCSGSAA